MTIADLLSDGLYLMLLGMGIVFSFLTLLVGAMKSMSALARLLDAGQVAQLVETPAPAPPSLRKTEQDDEIVAVITAAVNRYRKNRH